MDYKEISSDEYQNYYKIRKIFLIILLKIQIN